MENELITVLNPNAWKGKKCSSLLVIISGIICWGTIQLQSKDVFFWSAYGSETGTENFKRW